MSPDWKTIRIESSPIEIIDGDRGVNYPKLEEFFEDDYCLFLNTSNVTKQGFNFSKTQFITKEKDSLLGKGKLKKFDIVLTTRGTVGNIAYFDEKIPYKNIRINSGMVIFRNNNVNVVSTKYFYQFLKSNLFRDQVISFSSGSAQPQLPIGDLKRIEFPIPPLSIQNRIAEILSSLDDKIELNRQTNATLEAIAQTIFKEWFVDFNYPGATGEMVDSPLGLIPKGWHVGSLTSELDIVYGKNLPTSKLTRQGYPVFGGNGLIGYFDTYIYEEPQVIVACRGAASGKINQSLPKSFVTNNSLVFSIPKSSIMTFSFLKYFCLNTDFTSYVSGSAQPQLTIEALDHANLLVPDIKLLTAFTRVGAIFESKMRENDIESSTLATIRDELLGKLMNGDVDV